LTRHFLTGAVVVAIANGIFSPWLLSVFLFYPMWYPTWAPAITEAVVAISSILLSTLTLMLSGIAAAVVERVRNRRETDDVSAMVWFGTTVLLTLPAVPSLLRAIGLS
jgi:heme/copper-type cytochrome/quinol oxidase subunit 3